jgi:transmembrane sensor
MSDSRPTRSKPAKSPGPPLHPVEWTVQAGVVDEVLGAMEASLARRRRRRRLGLAGGAAGAVMAALLVWREPSMRSPAPTVEAARSVVVSRPTREVLGDGSIVEMRSGAQITVDFTAAVRRVILVRGQAHFQVAKNPGRPFVVAVDGVEVRAVGTAFSVQRGSTSVEVVVTEGRVAIDAPTADGPAGASPAAPPLAYVDAGHNAVVERPTVPARASGGAAQVASLTPAELSARLAWRVPRFEFSGTSLADVLAHFNDYNPVQTVLADPALGSLRVSGILRADNIQNLWLLLAEQHGIRATPRGENEVVLSRGG